MRFVSNPRVYIYSGISLMVCLLFWWHARVLEKHGKSSTQDSPAQPAVQQRPVLKEAEMGTDVNASLPRLYLFGDEESLPFAVSLREKLAGKCAILHIKGSNEEMRDFFRVTAMPAGILFNVDNLEIGRFAPPLAEDTLEKQVLELLSGKD